VEFPHLEKLVKKYGPQGFVVVTVNTEPESNADGLEFMAKKGYHFTHLAAPSSDWAGNEYKFMGAPTTVLLDQQRRVILRHEGFSLAGVRAMDLAINRLLQPAIRTR
jgi:thiol-disulfide isomerase/thioredoxin